MELETLISSMMKINIQSRLWHWMTDSAQQHTTFESFLTQNETFTDSLVESALGNDISIDFSKINVVEKSISTFKVEDSREKIKSYRHMINKFKQSLSKSDLNGSEELIAILDDITELSSKSLYLLKLK